MCLLLLIVVVCVVINVHSPTSWVLYDAAILLWNEVGVNMRNPNSYRQDRPHPTRMLIFPKSDCFRHLKLNCSQLYRFTFDYSLSCPELGDDKCLFKTQKVQYFH